MILETGWRLFSAYLAAKDPAFKPSSTLRANITPSRSNAEVKPAQQQSLVFKEGSKYLDLMIKQVREIGLKNGIDIYEYDQIKRGLKITRYLIGILQKN